MPNVTVTLPHHRYDILIEPGALDRLGSLAAALAPHERCVLIGDATVARLYGDHAIAALRAGGYDVAAAHIESGESHKTLDTVRAMYDVALAHRLERRSPILALGGGVVGDTAGFVAATYLRGVPFVQVPTSLLAMVDSSVGGKVGVNVPQGKNLIGCFHQPVLVVIDPLVLQTLPPRELRCGLAECVKHGVIRDASLVDFIGENLAKIQALEPSTMAELIARNVAIKASVVMEDEREAGVRAHLNFGHTFAHAIEATAGYGKIEHGEAVSLGMVAASHLAASIGLCDSDLPRRIVELCESIGLPIRAKLPGATTLMNAMKLDKKVADSRIRFVLPDRLGSVVIRDDVPPQAVSEAWERVRSG